MLLCGLDGILSSCMAQLLLNCFENMLLCNVYHQNDVADIGYFGLRELMFMAVKDTKVKKSHTYTQTNRHTHTHR